MEHFFMEQHDLGLWELKHDILFEKIPRNDYDELIEFAWKTGFETAQKYSEKWLTASPLVLADRLNLTVLELKDGGYISEHYRVFSEYFSNMYRVVLYQNTIKAEIPKLISIGHADFADYEILKGLFVAHEIFHHIECHEQGLTSARKKIVTFKCGPVVIKSGIRALCEIGAHSFTRTLMKL